jgi:hypothetical protein
MSDGWLHQRSRSFTTLPIPIPMEHLLLCLHSFKPKLRKGNCEIKLQTKLSLCTL